jgi:hypothetical protein
MWILFIALKFWYKLKDAARVYFGASQWLIITFAGFVAIQFNGMAVVANRPAQ